MKAFEDIPGFEDDEPPPDAGDHIAHTWADDIELRPVGPEQAAGVAPHRAEAAPPHLALERGQDAPDRGDEAGGVVVDGGHDAAGGAAPPRALAVPAQPVRVPPADAAALRQVAVGLGPGLDDPGPAPRLERLLAPLLGQGVGLGGCRLAGRTRRTGRVRRAD